ncbi:MAG: GntP family permease [Turicibacter sp.]|nr:GntP family permease [Turicibacter sp.]
MGTDVQLVAALVIGVSFLIFLILKTKVHTFLALMIAAVVVGLIAGQYKPEVIASIQGGFGGTLGGIGIIIGFGVMLGQVFEMSGAAERMARTFLKLFGKGREEFAMALTGFIVSIPVFVDSAFIMLFSIVKAISKKSRKSILAIAVPLAGGAVITHSMIPPTPGPLGVAGAFGVDVGEFFLLSFIIAIPMAIGTTLYGATIGKKIYQLPSDDGEGWIRPSAMLPGIDLSQEEDTQALPSAFLAFLPILTTILLILINTTLGMMGLTTGFFGVLRFLGMPMIALGIGLLIAIYTLARKVGRDEILGHMESGIKSAGVIILVTGAGGALGRVLSDSGVGEHIAYQISQTPIPVILLPFVVSTIIRFAQGSGTVAMITAASITAPIVIAAGGNPLLGAFAACVGSLFFSYFNDSLFWVVNRMCGIDNVKEQMKAWSVTTTIAWAIGLVMILGLNVVM